MAWYDDTVLEEAADTTAKQLADGWFTWANTQQPPLSSALPKNTGQEHYDLDSCVPKQWKRSTQTKELEHFGLSSSMLSPFCDDLSEVDNQGSNSPPAGELNCDPYLPAYTGTVFKALDLNGPEHSAVDADIFKQFNELIFFNILLHFSSLGTHSELLRDLSTELTEEMPLPFTVTHTRKAQLKLEQLKQKSNGCLNSR